MSSCCGQGLHLDPAVREDARRRLRSIRGHVEGILKMLLMDLNLPDSRVHPLMAAFDPRIDIGTAVEYAKSFVDLKDCVRRSAGPAEVAPVAARMRSAFYAMYGARRGA